MNSIPDLIAHLAKIELAVQVSERKSLEKAARVVEKRAKDKIGEYQSAVGDFAAWAELADSTKADRERRGFTENDPGLRTGSMRDSIEHTVRGSEAEIGSNDDHLVFFELGTKNQPPRSVLGGAMAEKLDEVRQIIGEDLKAALTGDGVFNNRLEIE